MQLTIESVQKLKTGKSFGVKAGGKDYLAKLDSGLSPGMVIDAEIDTNEYNGKTYTWIGKWKPITAAQVDPDRGLNTDIKPATAAPIWANFVSNQVAHAIQAGLITDPSHIKVWAAAAKQAFTELA